MAKLTRNEGAVAVVEEDPVVQEAQPATAVPTMDDLIRPLAKGEVRTEDDRRTLYEAFTIDEWMLSLAEKAKVDPVELHDLAYSLHAVRPASWRHELRDRLLAWSPATSLNQQQRVEKGLDPNPMRELVELRVAIDAALDRMRIEDAVIQTRDFLNRLQRQEV